MYAVTASLSCLRLGMARPSVARFEPSTTTWRGISQSVNDERGWLPTMVVMIKAVRWDFGGVILTSPFEAFRRYESEHNLPIDFIRAVNATDPHTNAWALMERSEVTPQQFDDLFAAESAA